MRHFTSECKDKLTGLSILLSECSYNMAMDWLDREIKKENCEVLRVIKVHKGWCPLMMIETGIPCYGKDIYGGTNVYYAGCRKFYYDEDRGLLLAD